MGRIYYLMGKSASGKDSLHSALLSDKQLELKNIILYTTRPQRQGEKNGREYFFIGDEEADHLAQSGRMIEERSYQTVHGRWRYMTIDDGQFQLEDCSYLMIGTLESYRKTKEYFGEEKIVPIYIVVEDGLRLQRALNRERKQKVPRYAEMCRRFLADEADFAEEKLRQAGISNCIENRNFNQCLRKIRNLILSYENCI